MKHYDTYSSFIYRITGLFIIGFFLVLNGFAKGQDTSEKILANLAYQAENLMYYAPEDANEYSKGALNQIITLNLENEPLEKALQQIVGKTNLRITYSKDVTLQEWEKPVTLQFEEATVLGALYAALNNTDLRLKITDRGLLILHENDNATIDETVQSEMQQDGIIEGRVTDSRNQEPLQGATVQLVGTELGAATGSNGNFRISSVAPGEYTLRISYLGFQIETIEVTVGPNETVTQNVSLEDDLIEGADVLVVAQQRGQARAFTSQRAASNQKFVVSSEQLERFPDENLSAALQRIPGVSYDYDRGEPGRVYIRGISPDLSSVQIDGARQASTSTGGRETDVAGISVDMIESVEVHKSFTPDQDAEGIGGIINLQTRRPTSERFLRADMAGGYNNLSETPDFRANATYGERFGRIGLMVNGSYSINNRVSNDIRGRWHEEEINGVPTIVPERIQPMIYRLDRERYGLTAQMDYLFDNNDRIYVRGFYNKYYDKTHQSFFQYRLDRGEYLSETENTGGRNRFRDRRDNTIRDVINLSTGTDFTIGSASVDAAITYSYGARDRPYYDALRFEIEPMNDVLQFNVTDDQFVLYDVQGDNYWANPSAYTFSYAYNQPGTARDSDIGAKFNVEIPFTVAGNDVTFKFGSRYVHKDKARTTHDRRWDEYLGDGDFTMDQMSISSDEYATIGGHEFPLYYRMDWDAWYSHLAQNPDLFVLDEERDGSNQTSAYDSRENLIAGYGMATIHFGNLMVLGGVRVEHTWADYNGFSEEVDEDGEWVGFFPLSWQRAGEVRFFPALHLRYGIGDMTNIRFAATETIARPSFRRLTPRQSIDRDREIPRISSGNPDLKPLESMNVDLSVDHYFVDVGVLGAGVFFKDIRNFYYRENWIQEGGEFDGWERRQYVNGQRALLWGFEFAWQQNLSFLPGRLSGLSVFANYTYTNSVADFISEGQVMRMEDQTPHTANFALAYSQGGFSSQISFNYQADTFTDFEYRSLGDYDWHGYDRGGWSIDFSANQHLFSGVSIFTEVNNLTNRWEEGYIVHPQRDAIDPPAGADQQWSDRRTYIGWRATLGLRYRM